MKWQALHLTSFSDNNKPVMQASPETLREMERCARQLARSVNYVGAATVEYLYDLKTAQYFFLELNPRLQACTPSSRGSCGSEISNLRSTLLLAESAAQEVGIHHLAQARKNFLQAVLFVDSPDARQQLHRRPASLSPRNTALVHTLQAAGPKQLDLLCRWSTQ